MGFLQRWLDEPDESIARFAKTFYVLAIASMVVFAVQVAGVFLATSPEVTDLIGPCVALFLAFTLYGLALDGRRSYKAMKAARDAAAPLDPKPEP